MTDLSDRTYSFLLIAFALLLAGTGPYFLGMFGMVKLSAFAAMAIGALGLAFAWGYLGILSFGHAAFYGLGAYAYAIGVINWQDSTPAVLLAIAVPSGFALLLGYFLFFGRVGDVYLGVITLCVTLVLYSFTTSTADPYYRVGSALLGGFNGITAVPPLNWPGRPDDALSIEQAFRLSLIVLAMVYYLLGMLRRSSVGRVLVAVRESEVRSELLGYDIRLYKLLGFLVSAAAAGLSGALFTALGGYVGPTVFGLNQASQFLLWVIAGGLGTLAGPMIASFGFQYLATFLGTSGLLESDIVFGLVILLFVLLAPQGLLPAIQNLQRKFLASRRSAAGLQSETPVALNEQS
jgi:ABC-type branched-subunit amino acid transport system permease subunit